MIVDCWHCADHRRLIAAAVQKAAKAERSGKPVAPYLAEVKRLKSWVKECADSGHMAQVNAVHNSVMNRYGHAPRFVPIPLNDNRRP